MAIIYCTGWNICFQQELRSSWERAHKTGMIAQVSDQNGVHYNSNITHATGDNINSTIQSKQSFENNQIDYNCSIEQVFNQHKKNATVCLYFSYSFLYYLILLSIVSIHWRLQLYQEMMTGVRIVGGEIIFWHIVLACTA